MKIRALMALNLNGNAYEHVDILNTISRVEVSPSPIFQSGHVPPALVGHDAYVFEAVALLDEEELQEFATCPDG